MSSTWSSPKKTTVSAYFKGNGLVKSSINSLYGQFVNTTSAIFNIHDSAIVNKYNIPTVVVIGTESSGKSSLLENIVKCPIFPRSARLCTKQPIHLKLRRAKDESDISYSFEYRGITTHSTKMELNARLLDIMNSMDTNEISEEVIVVNICDIDLPHFEFIDLPGIRAYPEDMAKATYQLSEKYITRPDTIIICVVPATTPRLTSYAPIALIKKHNRLENTIISLTMCDRVQDENIKDLIIDRLVGDGDEFTGMNFVGCTAVINRKSDSDTLISHNKYEEQWFQDKIIDLIPEDYPHTDTIINNVGIGSLIDNIDGIYKSYIQNKWIPKTITELQSDITYKQNLLTMIGPETIDDILLIRTIIFDELIKMLDPLLGKELINDNWRVQIIGKSGCILDKDYIDVVEGYNAELSKNILNYLSDIITTQNNPLLSKISFKRFRESFLKQIKIQIHKLTKNISATYHCCWSHGIENISKDITKATIQYWLANVPIEVSNNRLIEDVTSSNNRKKLKDEISTLIDIIGKLGEM